MSDTAKPTKVTRPGLHHARFNLKEEDFFQHIDDCGGWPLEYPYVGFAHSEERSAAFTMESTNTGWWTTLYHRDDYLMWKLSPAGWERIFNAIKSDIVGQIGGLRARSEGPAVMGWSRSRVPLSKDFKAK